MGVERHIERCVFISSDLVVFRRNASGEQRRKIGERRDAHAHYFVERRFQKVHVQKNDLAAAARKSKGDICRGGRLAFVFADACQKEDLISSVAAEIGDSVRDLLVAFGEAEAGIGAVQKQRGFFPLEELVQIELFTLVGDRSKELFSDFVPEVLFVFDRVAGDGYNGDERGGGKAEAGGGKNPMTGVCRVGRSCRDVRRAHHVHNGVGKDCAGDFRVDFENGAELAVRLLGGRGGDAQGQDVCICDD